MKNSRQNSKRLMLLTSTALGCLGLSVSAYADILPGPGPVMGGCTPTAADGSVGCMGTINNAPAPTFVKLLDPFLDPSVNRTLVFDGVNLTGVGGGYAVGIFDGYDPQEQIQTGVQNNSAANLTYTETFSSGGVTSNLPSFITSTDAGYNNFGIVMGGRRRYFCIYKYW
jgi:hypothetical protein